MVGLVIASQSLQYCCGREWLWIHGLTIWRYPHPDQADTEITFDGWLQLKWQVVSFRCPQACGQEIVLCPVWVDVAAGKQSVEHHRAPIEGTFK
jgi:hypothetical protein